MASGVECLPNIVTTPSSGWSALNTSFLASLRYTYADPCSRNYPCMVCFEKSQRKLVCLWGRTSICSKVLIVRVLTSPQSERSYYESKQMDVDYQLARNALKGPGGPFEGWIASGREWEDFDSTGNVLATLPRRVHG